MVPRLAIEHLGVEVAESADRCRRFGPRRRVAQPHAATQPTTRYHGNVAAFMAEVRSRIAAGENVMVSAASTGSSNVSRTSATNTNCRIVWASWKKTSR